MQRDKVIIVNEEDEALSIADKMEAHRQGLLHRAFSVFILSDKDELLLQQRATGKYHSQELWSNTCCSHPMPGEETIDAARRRLMEEMGFNTPLKYLFPLRYCANVGNGLIENELDHVYIGYYSGEVKPDQQEVKSYRYMSLSEIERLAQSHPETFTAWFHLALPKFKQYVAGNKPC